MAKVHRWVRTYQRRLLLDSWTVDCDFAVEPHPDDHGDETTVATAGALDSYSRLVVTVYPTLWDHDEKEQEAAVAHEMAHAITAHTRELLLRRVAKKRVTDDEAMRANEKLTEHIANVVLRAYR